MARRIDLNASSTKKREEVEENDDATPVAPGAFKRAGEASKNLYNRMDTNAKWALAGWVFLILFPLTIGEKGADSVREWWWAVITDRVGLALIIGFTLFGLMMHRDPRKPFRKKLAVIGTFVLVGFALWHVFARDWTQSNTKVSTGSDVSYSFPAELAGNEVARTTYDLWMRDSGLTQAEAYEMFEVCREESLQFTDFVGKYPDGSLNGAVGPCHVKPASWGDKAKDLGYDPTLTDVEDNVRMAIWIRNNDPAWESKWALLAKVRENQDKQTTEAPSRISTAFASVRSRVTAPAVAPVTRNYTTTETIIVPVGTWSEVVDVSSSPCHLNPDKPMKAMDQNGRIYDMAPGNVPQTSVFTFQFMVESETEGKMVLRCY